MRRGSARSWILVLVAIACAPGATAGCQGPDSRYAPVDEVNNGSPNGPIQGSGTGGSSGGTGSSSTSSSGAVGVPCDVAQALTVCVSCHSDPPVAGAVGSLLTYADLTAPAPTDATMTMAQMAVTRMTSPTKPMPPAPLPGATAAQIMALSSWVAAGSPMGTCVDNSTFQGAPTCPSNNYFNGNTHSGETMYPGQACLTCHAKSGGPSFTVGGTVFATGKVLDDCLPPAGVDLTQAQVVLHDANGDHVLSVLSDGNFRSQKTDILVFPFTAKVVYQGNERAMVTAQSNGDCNSCHTANGANGAPGRIALP